MATIDPKGTILIIDDEPDFRLILSKFLGFVGYRVLEADDGRNGLEVARRNLPDLILTDWMMPGMDGEAFCKALKADPELGNIYVIMVTAKGRSEDVVRGLDLGADDYLVKPVDRMELLARVRAGLRVSTLQRELAVQLRETRMEQARLTAIIDNVADIIVVTDAEGGLVHCNCVPAQESEDNFVSGILSQEQIDPRVNEQMGELFAQAVRQGGAAGEVNYGDGRIFYVRWTPVRVAGDSDYKGWVATVQDITHFKKLDQLKSEMVAQVAHDLKSPLMTIYGYAELLEMSDQLDDTQRQSVDYIMRGAERIRALVDDLLDIERVERGILAQEECDLASIAAEAAMTLREQVPKQQLSFLKELDSGLPPIVGDPTLIRQAIVNLLDNACKYTLAGGEVRLRVNRSDDELVVSVADTGSGISPDILPRLFERFYRAPGQPGHSGTGLGLAIVKSVAEAHGGHAWVESKVGRGTIFYISFPLHLQTDQPNGKGHDVHHHLMAMPVN